MDERELLSRRLAREKAARQAAEAFIEAKSLELYAEQERRKEAFEALQAQIALTEAANRKLQEEVLWHTLAEAFEADRRRLLERIARGHPLEEVLRDLKQMAEHELPGGRCAIFVVPPPASRPAHEPLRSGGLAGSEIREVEVVEDASRVQPWSSLVSEGRMEAYPCWWILPLLSREGEAAGHLVMGFRWVRRPGDLDIHTLKTLCGLAEVAIGHRQLLEALAHQAQFDALTDLPNRFLLQDRLRQATALAQRRGSRVGVLFLDLDGFKHVNDTLGHQAGDLVLVEVAKRLKPIVRRSDTLARMGGDEFMLVLSSLREPQDAARVAQLCIDALRTPVRVEGHDVFIGTSIGISLFPQDAQDPQALQRNADAAMYLAKTRGKNNFQFFTENLDHRARERLELESHLRRACGNGELMLYYQPQLSGTGRVVGMEALLRWRHPRLGMIPPGKFIPIAEECGLIVSIGNWVLQEACRQMAAWRRVGFAGLVMAVNISLLQFEGEDWVSTVKQALAESGLPPAMLELELTEGLMMQNAAGAATRLGQLRSLGVRFAVDDFGTGYSSLAYLQRLPLDTLKIDQSFIRDMTPDSDLELNSTPIVRTIIALAKSLGLALMAEGVETEAQAALLREMGCDGLQGYLFARPMPPEDCEAYLRGRDWG